MFIRLVGAGAGEMYRCAGYKYTAGVELQVVRVYEGGDEALYPIDLSTGKYSTAYLMDDDCNTIDTLRLA